MTKENSGVMQDCYSLLLDSLCKQNSELVTQTKTFVHELRRITVLWDEAWIGVLMTQLGEMKKQILRLESEISKFKKNSLMRDDKDSFMREKYNNCFKKVIAILEHVQSITNELPETQHEVWFQRNFSKVIQDFINSLKAPVDPFEPQQVLTKYQQLLQLIQKKAIQSQCNGRSQLIMDTISPVITKFENTVIPLPGINKHKADSTPITIQKVCKTVTILHTKTKPKKIAFYGSNGKIYTYLFKGHEDLHLDERVMQFLTVVNNMLAKQNNKHADKEFYARHYSVTPLGPKSGLIQWVDGGQALYSFYKRWMLNKDSSTKNSAQDGLNKNTYKPSEIFSKKLLSKNIRTSNRAEWPVQTLIAILQELIEETPNDLITKELWCCSRNAHEFWQLSQNFVHSNAVMCMIGYVIGLGDRHLDNILLDLSTGEVIHIDYNICFEKGKTLRVPEKVSCRLTSNIVKAFGLTGIEGTFRISSEHVLRILRKGRETLLTLLEAFVYDPLIDWTPGHEDGFTGSIYGGRLVKDVKRNDKKNEATSHATSVWKKVKLKVLRNLRNLRI